ncbi:unnamed protein product, partial [Allacma fusca]
QVNFSGTSGQVCFQAGKETCVEIALFALNVYPNVFG